MSNVGTELSLRNFFIFNAVYGQQEGEEERKILYFYPKETKLDLQMKAVGLSEAIIKFSETFSTDPCEALQTEKTRRLFYQPEPNFWMVLTINVPTRRKNPLDPLEVMEYVGGDVQNTVFLAVLRQAYNMAKLFIGPFHSVVGAKSGDTDVLRRKLGLFFDKYLSTLPLKYCDILDVFQGVQFLPLDKKTFLHAQCLVNRIEALFPCIQYSVLFYNEHLIWSGLHPEDVQVLYKYVTSCFRPSVQEAERLQQPDSIACGRFLRGPSNIDNVTFTGKAPKLVYLKHDDCFYQLVMYELLGAILCLFIKNGESLMMDFYRELDRVLRQRLTELTREFVKYKVETEGREWNQGESEPSEGSRFVYFNSMNLATKTTFHQGRRTPLAAQALRLFVDIHDAHLRLFKAGVHSSETYAKTMSDLWVVGRMSNSREFYVTIYKKKSKLREVNDDVDKICRKYLREIFFHV